jgi:hypothetical protein
MRDSQGHQARTNPSPGHVLKVLWHLKHFSPSTQSGAFSATNMVVDCTTVRCRPVKGSGVLEQAHTWQRE